MEYTPVQGRLMSEKNRIRSMAVADLEAVTRLETICLQDGWSPGQWKTELNAEGAVALVAEAPNGVVGVFSGRWVAGELEIFRIATDPDFQRQSVATTLLRTVIRDYVPLGLKRVLLEVRLSNLEARSFYKKNGFNACGIRKGYYADGEDALLMELQVSS